MIWPVNFHCHEQEEHENETSVNILISSPVAHVSLNILNQV